jgi:hypothetical protein
MKSDYGKRVNDYFSQYFGAEPWERGSKNLHFRIRGSNFPPMRYMTVSNDKIYIITYRKNEQKYTECVVLDINGTFITTLYIPIPEQNPMTMPFYAIDNDNLYVLHEYSDKEKDIEEWRIYVYKNIEERFKLKPNTPPKNNISAKDILKELNLPKIGNYVFP